ncbi:hypothetical protein BOO69_09985 [Sulfitobacter alexandrii]|uniref:VOC domain-containing protein n=1 Tax=Sulfitobacter alexandrii TaxID=1917485 RepID=A0A1J0WHQ4_9RHOB|nr:VOC family protein [Sulfitobacter alexandrii]APE43704.1 hypothetical protein BOO69_09985 [Sulfitobacter alexandrii]
MLIPATRYRDCEAALTFLTEVLAFEPLQVFRDDDGVLVHVELKLGQGVFMFGPDRDNAFGRYMVHPDRAGGETTTIYAVVPDVAARHERAVAAGADVVLPLEAQPQGGSSFTLRDPEGHVWTFGDYDPGAAA